MVQARPNGKGNESFTERLKEISRFFAGCSQVHKAMRRLVARLKRFEVPYTIVGGMAVNAHGHQQTTDDVDLLLTAENFTRIEGLFLRTKYNPAPDRRQRFFDRINGVLLDIVITGKSAGGWRGSPITYPDPSVVSETIDKIAYVNLKTLVELKLASRRYRDLGDVGALIAVHDLDESFMKQLHPALHNDYRFCLNEKRREEEYEARQ
ncbi:MAG TPA: hypothetical protein VN688_23850 [Gemmataceae bacterium]|nr:hypothetical protein [Gemmataceae bacterium]